MQAVNAARSYLLKDYAPGKTRLRCLAYTKPQGLVNWAAPHVTFVKNWTAPNYHGPAWQVHFVAPRQPGARANVVEVPGDDFDLVFAQDGRLIGTGQAFD